MIFRHLFSIPSLYFFLPYSHESFIHLLVRPFVEEGAISDKNSRLIALYVENDDDSTAFSRQCFSHIRRRCWGGIDCKTCCNVPSYLLPFSLSLSLPTSFDILKNFFYSYVLRLGSWGYSDRKKQDVLKLCKYKTWLLLCGRTDDRRTEVSRCPLMITVKTN